MGRRGGGAESQFTAFGASAQSRKKLDRGPRSKVGCRERQNAARPQGEGERSVKLSETEDFKDKQVGRFSD